MPLTTRRFLVSPPPVSHPSSPVVRFSNPQSIQATSTTSLGILPSLSRKRLRPPFPTADGQMITTGASSSHAVLVEPIGLDVNMEFQNGNEANAFMAKEKPTISFTSESQSVAGPSSVRENKSDTKTTLAESATLETVEFSFLDNKNVCCGLCGEIVPYEQLMTEHLPGSHPNVFAVTDQQSGEDGNLEQEQQQRHLREKLLREKRCIESGFKMSAYRSPARVPRIVPNRFRSEPARKVSTIRVNPRVMSLPELELALKKKMHEKLNRRVPVTLMDKIHARCGMCNAIISLNKKFEIVHLVRHFNCWHPTVHSCAGTWQNRKPSRRGVKLLSIHDFAVVDTGSGTPDSLQCIWCGMFVESHCLAQHFGEVHSDDVEVPKCNLCMQELILTGRYQEKFNIELRITLPDEHHMRCNECGISFSNEINLDNHVQRRHVDGLSAVEDPQGDEDDVNLEEIGPEAFANSRMTLGKRRRPKRQFIMPALRQAVPLDSEYVEPIAECHWKCKICEGDIYGAVISAAAIRHYKFKHPDHVDNMQYEICKSRLEKISDGCMEFVHPQLIECLLCQQSFNLHQPFNMCRAIRHLKAKHPNLMPEYAGLSQFDEYDEDEDGTSSVVLRRHQVTTAMVPMESTQMVFTQQNMIQVDANGMQTAEGIVFTNQVSQGPGEDADDETEEIIAVGGSGTIGFDTEPPSGYPQQYVSAGGGSTMSTPMAYQGNPSELNTPIGFNSGIRVFRTPQHIRYDDHGSYHTYVDSNMAAKNARLDHGAIVRQLPNLIMDSHRPGIHVQGDQSQMSILGGRLLEAPTVVFQHQQQSHPRQYYLVLQPSAVDSPGPSAQQNILDSSMDMAHDRSMDRRSVISVMDDALIESQRLTELMSQAHSALASATSNDPDHGQPQVLMAGDEPLM